MIHQRTAEVCVVPGWKAVLDVLPQLGGHLWTCREISQSEQAW